MTTRKRSYSWELKKAIEKHGFTPVELEEGEKRKVGGTYWNGYWQKFYVVVDMSGSYLTVMWSDGRSGTHCTLMDYQRDWKLIWSRDKMLV